MKTDGNHDTLERFREARDEEKVVPAVRTWAGTNPVEIVRVDVLERTAPRIVELWLILDAPISFAERIAAPREQLPSDLHEKDLYKELVAVLGPGTNLVARVQIRYSGLIELKTGRYLGLPSSNIRNN